MLVVANQLFLVGDELGQVFEVGGEDVLVEVVAMEKRDVAVVPQQLEARQLLVQVDIVAKHADVDALGCNIEMAGYLLALEPLDNFSPLLLQIGGMLELEGLIDDVVLSVEEELQHFELVFEELAAEVVLGVGFFLLAWAGGAVAHGCRINKTILSYKIRDFAWFSSLCGI